MLDSFLFWVSQISSSSSSFAFGGSCEGDLGGVAKGSAGSSVTRFSSATERTGREWRVPSIVEFSLI